MAEHDKQATPDRNKGVAPAPRTGARNRPEPMRRYMACVCSQRGPSGETHNMAFCAGRTTAQGGDGAAFSLAARLGSLCAEGAQSRSHALLVRRVSGGRSDGAIDCAGLLYPATGRDLRRLLAAT